MTQVSLEEAQLRLPELIAGLRANEELQIMNGETPVARLVALPPRRTEPRRPGAAIGLIRITEEDDSHLEHFRDYMH